MAVEFNETNFQSEVLDAKGAVVVDFWAPWCGPCRQLGPVIEQLASENTDVKIGKFNVDEGQTIAERYGITSIPAVLFFQGGQVVDSVLGAQPKSVLQSKIDRLKATA